MSGLPPEERIGGIVIDELSTEDVLRFDPSSKKQLGEITLGSGAGTANHALVIMVVGIATRWKHVIGYHFTGDSVDHGLLKQVIEEGILAVEEVGVIVEFVTCDCSPCNKRMWRDFDIVIDKDKVNSNQGFEHPLDPSRRIEIIPDPVHLFKSMVRGWINNRVVRLSPNIITKYNLIGNEAKIEHLTDLVQWEHSLNISPCHTLTLEDVDFSLNVSNIDKMKVLNSVKYVNPDVADALRYMAEETSRPELRITAGWIEDISRWYSIMNSSDGSRDVLDPRNNPTHYKQCLKDLRQFAEDVFLLEVGDDAKWKPWQSAVILSTNAIIRLQNKLFRDYDFPEVEL